MDAKRTPGPWEVAGPSGNMGESFVIETSNGEKTIGWVANTGAENDEHGVTTEEDEANAAFIVRACNNHDALLGALENITRLMGRETRTRPQERSIYYHEAEAAIAGAEKGGKP